MRNNKLFIKLVLLVFGASICNVAFAEDDSPVGDKMEAMGHALQAIQKQVTNPAQKDSTLALIFKMKKNAVAAKNFAPPMAKTVPEKNRDQFVQDYKTTMDELIEEIDSLDKAVRSGKQDEAQTIIKYILGTKREGHSMYTNKKGKEGHRNGGQEDERDD